MNRLLAALLLTLAGVRDTEAAPLGDRPDSARARELLATLLHVAPSSPSLRVLESPISFHPNAIGYVGEVPGYHAPARAWVARLPDGTLIPLGCRQSRLLLQAEVEPHISDDSLVHYVAVLAALDGAVPPLSEPVLTPTDVPERFRTWADERGVRLDLPVIRSIGGGAREVTVLLRTQALYRVVAIIGASRWEDSIRSVELVMGVPPG